MSLIDSVTLRPASSFRMLLRFLILGIIGLQVAYIVFETELVQSEKKIITVDCLSVATSASVASFTSNEGNILAHTLLNGFTSLLRNFSIFGESFLHYATNVRDGKVPILFLVCALRVFHDLDFNVEN